MAVRVNHTKTLSSPSTGTEDKIYGQDYVDPNSHVVTGVGTMAEQNANAVAITGGTITGVSGDFTALTVNGGPVGGASSSIFQYRVDAGLTMADPGGGRLRFNNAIQTSATQIAVDWQTQDGMDIHVFLKTVQPKKFAIQEKANALNYQVWNITAVTELADYFVVDVTLDSQSGTPQWPGNAAVSVIIDSGSGSTGSYINVNDVQNVTNRIINGKFAIDQRNAGVSMLFSGSELRSVDRWKGEGGGGGGYRMQRVSDFPRAGEYALDITATTVDASLTGTDFYTIQQAIEGYNVVDLSFGTPDAQPFTFAFNVYANFAATLPISFRNNANARSYVTTYTIPADTHKTIVVTVPGDVTGTWEKTNGRGMLVDFCLGAAAFVAAPSANSWVAGNFITVAGCTNVLATFGNILRIANVRLYKGSVDFGPDQRLYAEELALCQRYYQKSFRQGIVPVVNAGPNTGEVDFNNVLANAVGLQYTVLLRPVMRANPTVTLYNPNAANNQIHMWNVGDFTVSSVGSNVSESGFTFGGTQPAGAIPGQLCMVHWTASAEL